VIAPVLRINNLMSRCLLASLALCVYAMCSVSIARADVDMTGRLEKVSSPKTTARGVQPFATSANGDYRCADEYSVVANWYYYFAIGNCRAGWEIDVVSYASENTVTHEHSYGGFVNNGFSGCGWIDTRFPLEKQNSNQNTACAGSGSSREFKVEESSFMERYDQSNANHDGNWVVNATPCPEYANYRPWSTSNVEKELIRTVPAYALGGEHIVEHEPALKWRYVTKYSSTDGTGKYVMVRDDRITGGGEGNWVFVPLACLRHTPSELPENGNERLPPPPTVTTGGFSNVTPTSASLSGSVNPNGLDTHYYIEWGREANAPYEGFAPTPYPGEDVGSGTKEVAKGVTATGLKPGTLYYYRIVAQSPTGTSEGALASFTTPQPPTAATELPSEVKERTVKLNGAVNPNGLDTHYYFEYGLTTFYGSTVPAAPGMDLGSGTGSVYTWNIAGKLTPSAEYHYRVVATNSAGTSDGSDRTFKTLATPNESSTWTVSDPYTNEEWLYYVGSGSAVWEWWFNGSKYEPIKLGGEVASGTTPAVVRDEETGQQWVYYVGKNEHAIWQFYWTGTKWESSEVGGQVASGSSVAAVLNPATGRPSVYYVSASGHVVWQFYSTGAGYGSAEVGGEAAPSTSPAIDRDPEHGGAVYVVGGNNAIWQFYWSGKAWVPVEVGGEVATGTSVAVAGEPATAGALYYVGRNDNAIWQFYWSGKAWGSAEVGGQVAHSTPLTVMRGPLTGYESLYYIGLNEGAVWKFYWNGASWIPVQP